MALFKACRDGEVDTVERLLDSGTNVNEQDNFGGTALMYASSHGHLDVVRLLLDSGANVNERDNDGWTALIFASDCGHTEVVRLLRWWMVYREVIHRRALCARVIGKWAYHADVDAPGTNSTFHRMGQVMPHCSFDQFKENFPDASEENYRFFVN